ncbi:MAG: alcohol dehydrogenase catalytic domain-containing protein [Micromonosporaceae bacterium]|nr:alcohol dehydrogenase catalytic domain-containing protein [Micromonosporaceae bacterium]
MSSYRRSVLAGPRRSRIDTAEVPEPGPAQILVRVLANGVCASELPGWQAGPAGPEPVALGHEPVGRVVAVGAGVRTPAVGDLVTGRLGSSFAELVVARAQDAVPVPPGLSPAAAVGEPLGCVVEAVRRSRVDVGDRVAVVGLGFMGLCLLQVLATSPVAELVAVDPRQQARERAVHYGATGAHGTGIAGQFDAVFEVTGVPAGLDLATRLTREHGTLSIVGYHQGARQVDMQAWNFKALEVVNGHVRDPRRLADSTARGLALVAAGRIAYPELFTHWYPLERVDDAFADLAAKPAGFIKAAVLFPDESA